MENIVENPSSTSPCSMDGKQGKPLALIMEPNLKGIKRVESMSFPTSRERSHV